MTGVAGALFVVGGLGACSDGAKEVVDSAARTTDAAAMDCDDPKMPVGEWKKRCASQSPSKDSAKETAKETAEASESPSSRATASQEEAASDSPTARTPGASANVGDKIALTGRDGQKFDVTLVLVVDPAQPRDTYSTPDPGNRLVALQWRVTNTGTVIVDAVPAFSTKLIDEQGQVFELSFGARAVGVEFPTSVQIPPGDSRLGFVTYEIPTSAKVVKAEFEGGYNEPSGQWRVA
ncbi:MAG TPA: DUF4352 domain-containing protein [Yinghuangia sp.]|nr:DUF4352 domain-containing protein [Yinghuangia sp.]